MSQRIVVNHCYGGFGISREAMLRLRELGCKAALDETDIGEVWKGNPDGKMRESFLNSFCRCIERNDPLLLQVMCELGPEKTRALFAKLEVIEIPDGIEWEIDDYDGMETVEEKHRRW
jgi:hypothetical protein